MSREGLPYFCLSTRRLSCSTVAVPQRAQPRPEPRRLCSAPGAGILFIRVVTLGEQLCLKLTFLQTRRVNLFTSGELQRGMRGLVLAIGFFNSELSHVRCPSGARVLVLPQRWGGPNSAQSPESSATFHGERRFSKICCSIECFRPPLDLFGFAGRAKQGLQRLMQEAAGLSHKKRDWRKWACVAWQNKS